MSINEFISKATKSAEKGLETAEIDIEEHYCKHAKKRGCETLKLIYLLKRSFPDRTTLCPGGRILFIEFKRKGKGLTKLQAKIRKLLESFGFEYHVCDQQGQAEKILDSFLDKSDKLN